ncbi:hypothetical protein V1512DRAFT_275936 [Lipomyces arxii]|uniref:uncharacterized protein n=1 Tax=Lipomyces arxii TaxID=56418 RepID=UPI0034CD9A1E
MATESMEEQTTVSVAFQIDVLKAFDCLRGVLGQQAEHIITSIALNQTELDLDKLALFALDPVFTAGILRAFYPLFLDLAARWLVDGIAEPNVVAAAFGRVLPLIPHAAVHAHSFFQNYGWLGSTDLQDLVTLYRLIVFDKPQFESLVDTKLILNVITDLNTGNPQKYVAILIWAAHLGLSDKATNELVNKYTSNTEKPLLGVYEGVQDIDYFFFLLIEAKRISSEKNILAGLDYSLHSSVDLYTIEDAKLSTRTANLCGVLVPRYTPLTVPITEIVYTDSTVFNVRRLASVLRSSDPLLISGLPGSGKTFLIGYLLSMLSRSTNDIVKLHLGDQTDTKVLVGSYSTGETPGSFVWKQGALAAAVRQGKVVVVEDIDRAPNEVLSALLSLVQQRQLAIPSRGETIRAGRGFQIIATVSESSRPVNFIGKELWKHVTLDMMTGEELEQVVANKFTRLVQLAPLMRQVYSRVRDLYQDSAFLALSRGAQNRIFSSRDLMKWARRVNMLLARMPVSEVSQVESFAPVVFDSVFYEAVDCFAASVRIPSARALIVGVIGNTMNVAPHTVQHYLSTHVPEFSDKSKVVGIGRITLDKLSTPRKKAARSQALFAHTKHTLRLLEQIATCVSTREPLLLVGETGTGKTTVVQQLAASVGTNIVVLNISQQTEAADLLGGYKPVDVKTIAVPLQEDFETLFERTFSSKRNERFTVVLTKAFAKSQWKNVTRLWQEAVKMADNVIQKQISLRTETDDKPSKKRRLDPMAGQNLLAEWSEFSSKVSAFNAQYQKIENSFVYKFIEGALVRAVRNGAWVLLDEINLAAPDTLESIADLLADGGEGARIQLSEKGDTEAVMAHPNFRIFACMNPATDVGKRDLPAGFRARFTEVYVGSPDEDPADLLAIIEKYIGQLAVGRDNEAVCQDVAAIYGEAKRMAEENLIVDGASQKPHFSIRTLARTLVYVRDITALFGLRRALYEGFCMSFLTLLDKDSEQLLEPVITKHTIGKLKNPRSVLAKIPNKPSEGEYIQFKHHWIEAGPLEPEEQEHYIMTPFVEKNMLNLVRAVATKKFPVLVQGPTSSGKTSMINYLARKTGHKFVRINNHEHTDLQEYIGSYVSDAQGNLRFQEGVLVEAARNGYWIVLDELNLAPTDVLEALNRLLDDNREIFIPETQEIVKPHPQFLLFASQNPPGLYGGRKNLSRAFRNRFLELHFDDIPEDELEIILKGRCQIPPSYAKKIVEVYKELSIRRQSTRIFEKNGFATLRDLFRWANREAVGYDQLALNGYLLLGERVRNSDEQTIVKEVIEKVMRVKIDAESFYKQYSLDTTNFPDTVWNKPMRRLFSLVNEAVKNREPVLLVGETGCGKTTVCQMLAEQFGKTLHIVNAHQNTEASDIIGTQRPLRNRSEVQEQLIAELQQDLKVAGVKTNSSDLDELLNLFDSAGEMADHDCKQRVTDLRNRLKILFEWCDGSLVQALKQGDFFLLDEISLTDDSVLERLNSVLEPERSILLAEKGAQDSMVSASSGFQFLATMNPSGDYGKKELSPALRNRFTEIWAPAIADLGDVYQIVNSKLDPADVAFFSQPIVKFASWFAETYTSSIGSSGVPTVSLRDILGWTSFIKSTKTLNPMARLLHGASMVFIDTLGTNALAYLAESTELLARERQRCVDYLSSVTGTDLTELYVSPVTIALSEMTVQGGMFEIQRSFRSGSGDVPFSFSAPTTAFNAMRIIRGMQLRKPIMLEGSPGVGKTSIMTALAAAAGAEFTRINLSDQTDLMDLFGSDSPVEGGKSGEFVWRDAPFLHAMQHGQWVLLDEMNLASQSVLEGLNACLDHRAEAYIPELDRTFSCHPNFKVFAAQNSHYQGGGRKGLPKSFVNRFTVVYMDILTPQDLRIITRQLYPVIDSELSDKLISFINAIETETSRNKSFGRLGSPWEFNLRDTIRWFQLLVRASEFSNNFDPSEYLDIVVSQRFRTVDDRLAVRKLYELHFQAPFAPRYVGFTLADNYLQVGHTILPRANEFNEFKLAANNLVTLQCNMVPLETLMTCVDMSWPAIIVGPANSGKTNLIRLLADIVGAHLEEFAINNDIDSMDIVGGFEQVDLSRQASKLWHMLRTLAARMMMHALHSADRNGSDDFSPILVLYDLAVAVDQTSVDKLDEVLGLFELIPAFSTMEFQGQIDLCLQEIKRLKLAANDPARQTPLFEWFDGILVRALESGHWLVLDNANLCGPSVLDRLNSLLENNGVLIINERGLDGGELNVIKPHPNFRLFLTVDPRNGELSRAMRNRGVEIYLEDLNDRATQWDTQLLNLQLKKFDNSVVEKSDVLEELNKLSLTQSQQNYSVLMNDLPTKNALSRVFGLLDGVPTTEEKLNSTYLTLSAADYLPILNKHYITRWAEAICKLSLYSDAEQQFAFALSNLFTALCHSRIASTMSNIYSNIPIHEYGNYQSLQTLTNSYNVSLFKNTIENIDSAQLSRSYDVTIRLLVLKERLAAIQEKAIKLKFSTLNYIEKSAAAVSKSKSSTPSKAMFAMLNSLSAAIASVMSRDDLTTTPMELINDASRLLDFAEDILALTENNNVDETWLPIYRDCVDVLVHAAESHDSSVMGHNDWTVFKKSVQNFGSKTILTSGKSMEVIWTHSRPVLPTTLSGWTMYLNLLELSRKLDAISASAGLDKQESIIALQQKILDACSYILQNSDAHEGHLKGIIYDVEMMMETSNLLSGRGNRQSWSSVMSFIMKGQALLGIMSDKQSESKNDMLLANLAGAELELNIKKLRYLDSPFSGRVFLLLNSVYSNNSVDKSGTEIFKGDVVLALINSISSTEYGRIADISEVDQEITSFGSILVANSNVFADAKLPVLIKLLAKHICEILAFHKDSTAETYNMTAFISSFKNGNLVSDAQIDSLETYLRDSSKETVCLVPTIKQIMLVLSGVEPLNNLTTGTILMKYAESLLHIYVPNIPYDPAIKPYVERARLENKVSSISSWLSASQILESIFNGPGTSLRVRSLQSELESYNVTLPPPRYFRPEKSQSNALFQELHRYFEAYIGYGSVEKLLSEISAATTKAADIAQAFQRYTRELIYRLRTQYPLYADLFEPLEIYLLLMSLGVGLISNAVSKQQGDSSLAKFSWLVDSSALRSQEAVKIADDVQKFSLDHNLSQSTTKTLMVNLLEWTAVRYQAIQRVDSTTVDTTDAILKYLYYQWSLNKARDESERKAKSTVFKTESDEAEEDREFKQMFPDYDEVISIESLDISHSNTSVDAQLLNLYMAIFSDSNDYAPGQNLIEQGLLSLRELTALELAVDQNLAAQILPATILHTTKLKGRFNSLNSTKTVNFYVDANISEVNKATTLSLNIKTRLEALHTRWPENEAIIDSLTICNDLLDLPINTPVAKLLAYVEKQLGSLHEWQKVASREFSVMDHIDLLNSIVVEWRRLELSSWPSLFDKEISDIKNRASEWFFFLYENVLSIPMRICEEGSDIKEHVNELLQAITAFIGSSPKGQFATRLQLIEAFATHALQFVGNKYIVNFEIISRSLKNICYLYEMFLPKIEESMQAQRKPLEKEINEIILLASWKDTNFVALKESARRSHHKLYKMVRKFREILSQPVRPVLENGLGHTISLDDLQKKFTFVSTEDLAFETIPDLLALCTENVAGWSTRPERLIDLQATAKLLRRYAVTILEVENPSLVTFTADLVDEMQRLRRETPSELTEENKGTVQFLKARKAKLLSDTFKELKRMGLKYRVRPDVLASQDSVTKILASTHQFDTFVPAELSRDFLRLLEALPRVRSCVTNHSEDLTPPQVQRGLGLVESLVHAVLTQRENICVSLQARKNFAATEQEFEALTVATNANPLQRFDMRGEKLSSLSSSIRSCCRVIGFAHSVCSSHQALSEEADSEVADLLVKWRAQLAEVAVKLDQIVPKNIAITTLAETTFVQSIYEMIGNFYQELLQIANTKKTFGYIINIVGQFLTSEFSSQFSSATELPISFATVSELDLSLRNLCDSILVVVQSINELVSSKLTLEADNWIPLATSRMSKVLQSLHYLSISSHLQKCLEVTSRIELGNPSKSSLVGAMVSLTMPLVAEYKSFADKLILKIAIDHAYMAKSSLALINSFFTIATSGYCSPQEPSNDGDDSGTQQGTGLGDGEGQDNISKTVGKDEDLTDNANEPEEKEEGDDKDKAKDGEDEDDAVDMDGDMQGETEELDDEDQEDDKSDEGDEENEDLDEEVGDIDNLDPNAVDEKMWDDGNTEEESKEKDTENNLQDSTLTDDLAAKTDDKSKPEPKESNEDQDNEVEDGEEDGDDEDEGAMDQEDDVKQQNNDDVEPMAPEGDALDLPEDMNLDNDDDSMKMDDDDEGMPEDDPLDKPAEIDDKNDSDEKMDAVENEQQAENDDIMGEAAEPAEEEQGAGEVSENGEDNDEQEETGDEGLEEDEDGMDIDENDAAPETAPDDEKEQDDNEQNNVSKSEGLHGPEDANEDEEQAEAALNGGENSKTEGDESNTQEATDDTTAQEKGSAAMTEETQESKTTEQNQSQSDYKQQRLGDSSEEWHRQNKTIEEAEIGERDESARDERAKQESTDEYRHLDDSEATYDTQALGVASTDQRDTIEDDSMAIDDEDDAAEQVPETIPEEAKDGAKEEEESTSLQQQYAGGIIGERKPAEESEFDKIAADEELEDMFDEANKEMQELDEVDAAKDNLYRSLDEARDLWQSHERSTQDLSAALCEQLRLILEPTLSTKLRGDFRTGKRLNMKRIIPYIASQYKKDKIWLRRTKPSKREYQIMLSLDDSRSMSESQSVNLAFDTLTLVTKALERLESGQISIVRFGETCDVVHSFHTPFSSEAGARAFQWFGFEQTRTDVHALVEKSIAMFDEAKSDTRGDSWQLGLIISDGLCEDHDALRRQVRRAREKQIMLVFIIVDGLQKTASGDPSEKSVSSILDLSQVSYAADSVTGQMSLKITKYLSSFPFEFYVIVRSIAELPSVLALVLRQYFAEIADL